MKSMITFFIYFFFLFVGSVDAASRDPLLEKSTQKLTKAEIEQLLKNPKKLTKDQILYLKQQFGISGSQLRVDGDRVTVEGDYTKDFSCGRCWCNDEGFRKIFSMILNDCQGFHERLSMMLRDGKMSFERIAMREPLLNKPVEKLTVAEILMLKGRYNIPDSALRVDGDCVGVENFRFGGYYRKNSSTGDCCWDNGKVEGCDYYYEVLLMTLRGAITAYDLKKRNSP